jgi:hypothetical protein
VASVAAVVLFTTRFGREKIGIGGPGGWGVTSTSDLTSGARDAAARPAEQQHPESKKDAAA